MSNGRQTSPNPNGLVTGMANDASRQERRQCDANMLKMVRDHGLAYELEQASVRTIHLPCQGLPKRSGTDLKADTGTGITVDIMEQVLDYGPGGRLWDASLVLASHLVCNHSHNGMIGSAIELGAGCGLVGVVSAKLGCQVCLTDKEYVLPLLWANARLNAHDSVEKGELWASRLEWGQRLPKKLLRGTWNYVLAADVVGCGDQALFPPLLKTLKQLCSEETVILMAYKPRARFEREFFIEARQHFYIKRISKQQLAPEASMEIFHAPVDLFEMKQHKACPDLSTCVGDPHRDSEFDFDQAGYVLDED